MCGIIGIASHTPVSGRDALRQQRLFALVLCDSTFTTLKVLCPYPLDSYVGRFGDYPSVVTRGLRFESRKRGFTKECKSGPN